MRILDTRAFSRPPEGARTRELRSRREKTLPSKNDLYKDVWVRTKRNAHRGVTVLEETRLKTVKKKVKKHL